MLGHPVIQLILIVFKDLSKGPIFGLIFEKPMDSATWGKIEERKFEVSVQ